MSGAGGEGLERLWYAYNEDIQAKRRERLLETLHEQFSGTDPEGTTRGREAYVDFCCEHLPAELGIEFDEVRAEQVSPGVVVIATRQRMGPHPMAPAEDRFMRVSMLSVWVDEGGWKLRAQQGMVVG